MKRYTHDLKDGEILSIFGNIDMLGCVFKITAKDMLEINGHSNDFWGWGHEDKDLYNRAMFFDKKIEYTYDFGEGRDRRFFHVFDHPRVKSSQIQDMRKLTENIFPTLSKGYQYKYIMSSGLNNIQYKVLERKTIGDNIIKITSSI